MQLPTIALFLATGSSFAAATTYPIESDGTNCRKGPNTSYDSVTTYSAGTQVNITCQAAGETITGDFLWDKTSDGCYVADYYVKTGTVGFISTQCPPIGGGSLMDGPISRAEIIKRGMVWIDKHVPYSQSAYYPDPAGTDYRTDCSGFVAMALHADAPGANTVSLPDIATEISWDDLQPGDFVGTLGPGTGGDAGHVTIFKSWADSSKKSYNSIECRGTAYGCVAYVREVGWTDGSFTSKPYKYIHVK